jgi:hypothetical protein
MYCPTCAAQNETDVKYCRTCGADLTLVSLALTKSGLFMLLNRISVELEEDKKRRQQPRIIRGLYWTATSLVFFVSWCIRLYQHAGDFGVTEVLGILSAFIFLGYGFREFARYYMAADRDEGSLSPTTREQLGNVLNLSRDKLSIKKVSPSPVPTRAAVSTETEPTTQHLDVKPHEDD